MTVLGSHNSWSYLPPKQWWLRPFAFIAKCQNVDIKTQYEKYGVRCFDLRIKFDGGTYIAHGFCKYRYTKEQLTDDLLWLNDKKDCYVRVLHEIRRKREYNEEENLQFRVYCHFLEANFKNIKFWCGRNLYNWEYDWYFDTEEPSCHENYASVSKYKYLIGWWPWLYAKLCNKEIRNSTYKEDILLVDFINIK